MNRRLTSAYAAVLTLFLIAGCNQAKPAAPAEAAGSAAPLATNRLNTNDFKPIWTNSVPLNKGDVVSRIFIEPDMILAVTNNNVVYVMGKTNGVLRYFNYVNGGGRQIMPPLVLQSRIVYPAQSSLEIYNRKTGDFDRSINLGFTISSGAVVAENDVFFGFDVQGGELCDVDLNADYVPIRWQLLVFGPVLGRPALYQNEIFVGSADGGVRAVSLDRDAMWPLDHDAYFTGGEIKGDIAADDSGVYAASGSGRLVCLDRANGKLKWQYFSPNPLLEGPTLTRTSVYQPVPGAGMAAIDKISLMPVDAEGKHKVDVVIRSPRWTSAETAQIVAEDRLYTFVRSRDNHLLALDREGGQVRYRGDGVTFSAIATNLTDSVIYAATPDGYVYAVQPILQPGSPGYIQ